MPRIAYIEKNFSAASLDLIDTANNIIEDYRAQGFTLTLRQLYYQFVARDLLPNTMRSYKNLGSVINNARLAGHIDWDDIEDRTRFVRSQAHWDSPAEILDACATQFRVNKWDGQPYHVEVWIEKDALVGVIERVCHRFDVPFMACRGYLSQSEQWSAAQRFRRKGKPVKVFHLGDHDPSGIDMTRDNADRQELFRAFDVEVIRLALNMDQIEQYDPPPNPAKITDSRADGYIREYGDDSWELDALEPRVIEGVIEHQIESIIEQDAWDEACQREQDGMARLEEVADQLRDEE